MQPDVIRSRLNGNHPDQVDFSGYMIEEWLQEAVGTNHAFEVLHLVKPGSIRGGICVETPAESADATRHIHVVTADTIALLNERAHNQRTPDEDHSIVYRAGDMIMRSIGYEVTQHHEGPAALMEPAGLYPLFSQGVAGIGEHCYTLPFDDPTSYWALHYPSITLQQRHTPYSA